MKGPTESYSKVHYELRPAKQVERRMLVDAFQKLILSGFPIQDYQYTGMGSIYFVDFILFHRLVGIKRLLSVEYSKKIAKRVEFNRPFLCVDLEIEPIGNVIPKLSKDLKHILWLDYDDVLCGSHLADIATAGTFLSVGSILLVTVDTERPTNEDDPKKWREYFQSECGEYFNSSLEISEYAFSQLPRRILEIIERAISHGISGRKDVSFIPIFNFVYKDGNRMMTIGGMIGTKSEARSVKGGHLAGEDYFKPDWKDEPCNISVPKLTRKERQYLDQNMPCPDGWLPKDFELADLHVLQYRSIYRFCPTYAEFFG